MVEVTEYNIMVDPQGNAMEYIESVVKDEPDVFKAYLVSDEDLQLYKSGGYICVEGKPQKVEVPEADPVIELKREYDELDANLTQALTAAFKEGNEEKMASIREELKELKEQFLEEVKANV